MNDYLTLLNCIRNAAPGDQPPSLLELETHLERRQREVGSSAFMEFAHLQRVASETWDAERCAHFAQVLRKARVKPKASRQTPWEKAQMRLDELPKDWQPAIAERISISMERKRRKGCPLWSAAHSANVIRALANWVDHCRSHGLPLRPTGPFLDRYATQVAERASTRTASDYVGRILAGMTVIEPGFTSQACEFVACDWRERAEQEGAITKTGSQLVGASEIYGLGFDLMKKARKRRLRGIHAARDFRNGILLSLGAALPQRARALSALAFDQTLDLPGAGLVHVQIPARMLKLPEDRKNGAPFERTLTSQKLAAALLEYRHSYRPLFDEGQYLFPSMLSPGDAISDSQIGRLTGDLTARAFGVRVSIHRLRDNVATEASEHLTSGGRAATALLGHRSERTVQRHYDHSTGLASAQEFVDMIEGQRSLDVELKL
ncbi:MAG: hypothetical protein ACJAVZ_003771 [Afipia broomeae]|jgi:hypothetical protein|tara:strand:- start:10761 stop:12065 length:1305 start_codon:yes stop_codon:yes gene_type:complete